MAIVPHQPEIIVIKRFLLALIGLFFLSSFAHAESERKLVFNLNYSDPCRSVSATWFTHARHAKGNRNGLLNENNGGYAGYCFYDQKPGTYWDNYWLVGALENSVRGGTFLAGPGVRFRTQQFMRFSIEAGFELPFVYYEIPKYQAYVYGFLPVRYRGISFEPPRFLGVKLGTFEFGERKFGPSKEKIKLYSIGWRKEF